MKLRHLTTLCAALLALCPTLATAQTSAVPGFISYQGRVVDAAGANVGAGTPVNRTVIFRIWDNPSSTATANLIYSEAQTVTVSEGEFSVLVGQGVANPTQTFSYSEADKKLTDFGTAFNGSARYLGVTVAAAATIATTDNEITPRQQIVSTAFAMRAKFAESIGSSSDLTLTPLSGTASNYGLGWYGTGRWFGTTAVDGPVLYGNSGGGLGSNNGSTKTLALQWNAAGQIGVGATTFDTNNKLTLQGDDSATPARQLVIRGNTDITKRLNIGFDTTGNKASLQSYTANFIAGNLLLNPIGGNVGIGTSSPNQALTVGPNPGDGQSVDIRAYSTSANAWKGSGAFGGSNATVIMGEHVGIAQIGGHGPTLGTWKDLTINGGGGNVGIGTGTAAPTAKLDVAGDIKSNGKSVPVAEENLRIVRGTLTAASGSVLGNLGVLTGLVVTGSGYSYVLNSAYIQITFNPPFSAPPTILVSNYSSAGWEQYVVRNASDFPTASQFKTSCSLSGTSGSGDTLYSGHGNGLQFIAIGPR
jgi:hypothetical protein